MARPANSAILLLALAGCTRPNPDFDDPNATATTTGSAGSTTVLPPTTSGTTIDSSGTDSGGTGTGAGTFTTAPIDPSTTTGGITTTTTTVDDTSSGAPVDLTTAGDATTGEQESEHLQFYDGDSCGEPLWCFNGNGGIFAGVGARTSSQACFTPKTPPPYRIVRIGWRIAAAFGDVGEDGMIEVRGHDGGGPGPVIASIALDGPALSPGAHAILPSIDVPVEKFCVGFVGGDPEPDAGLGVAVDPGTLPPEQSYLRMEGGGPCDIPDWIDIAEVMTTPSGTWCIDADVVPAGG